MPTLAVAVLLASCASTDAPPTVQVSPAAGPFAAPGAAEEAAISALLDRLYATFNYAPTQEPDWDGMRACFVDNAVFVPEPVPDYPLRAQGIDAFIDGWRTALRLRPGTSKGYAERIDTVHMLHSGSVAHVNLTFTAQVPDDSGKRRPGLDSLTLLQRDGQWLVVSFTVQSESKL